MYGRESGNQVGTEGRVEFRAEDEEMNEGVEKRRNVIRSRRGGEKHSFKKNLETIQRCDWLLPDEVRSTGHCCLEENT